MNRLNPGHKFKLLFTLLAVIFRCSRRRTVAGAPRYRAGARRQPDHAG